MSIDLAAPIRFLLTAFDGDDWVAIFLKTYRTGETAQRVAPVSTVMSSRFQAWLRHRNANGWNVYVSVNAISPGRSRTRNAVAAVRHVFLEEDHDGPALLERLASRRDLPAVSYLLHSSPGRLHVFWRAREFDGPRVESLQKHLARELGTDAAATSCAQTTRLPGFINHKYARGYVVQMHYRDSERVLTPSDFPTPLGAAPITPAAIRPASTASGRARSSTFERARRYLKTVAPAIAGRNGDARTFRICCRLVRGFALTDDEALAVLNDWNATCEPPWTECELREKLRNARQYGREPVGGLLEADDGGALDA